MDGATVVNAIPAVREMILAENECTSFLFLNGSDCEVPSAKLERVDVASLTPAVPSPAVPSPWLLVYDVMRSHNGRVPFFKDYCARVRRSLNMALQHPVSDALSLHVEDALRAYAGDRAARHPDSGEPCGADLADLNVKFLMWIDAETRVPGGFVVFFIHSFFPPASWYDTGIRLALLFNASRTNPSAKIVQAPLRARATALQKKLDAFEALLVHDKGDQFLIPEGSRSNYFLITSQDQLVCSSEEDILVGITLQAARHAAVTAGLEPVRHEKITLAHIMACPALVMLGTSPGVLPVREIVVFHDAESKAEFERACVELGVAECHKQRVVVCAENPCLGTLPLHIPHPVATQLRTAYCQLLELSPETCNQ